MKFVSWAALVLAVAANIGANAAWKSAIASLSPHLGESSMVQLLRKGDLWVGLALAAVLLSSSPTSLRFGRFPSASPTISWASDW